jgi:hypothetical protein
LKNGDEPELFYRMNWHRITLYNTNLIKSSSKGGISLNEEKDKVMRQLILDWGLPGCLKENGENIIFKFDDDGLVNTKERGYHCKDGDVKFCLFIKQTGNVLFSMDFHKNDRRVSILRNRTVGINLELLYVHDDSLRNKGISSYYIEKLKDYTIGQELQCIYVRANENAENFKDDSKKNSLSQKDLEDFYQKRGTKEMPISLEH